LRLSHRPRDLPRQDRVVAESSAQRPDVLEDCRAAQWPPLQQLRRRRGPERIALHAAAGAVTSSVSSAPVLRLPKRWQTFSRSAISSRRCGPAEARRRVEVDEQAAAPDRQRVAVVAAERSMFSVQEIERSMFGELGRTGGVRSCSESLMNPGLDQLRSAVEYR
jgi:hypothetical protein